MFTFTAKDENETSVLAKAIARSLPDRLTIGLVGTLGAGKTFFVMKVSSFWNIDPSSVVSPTFTICNEYHGDRKVFHFDFYRIKDEDELLELGVEETFDSNAISFVEWADRFSDTLPDEMLRIEISVNEEEARIFTLTTQDATTQAVIDSVAQKING